VAYSEITRKAALLHLAIHRDAEGKPRYTDAENALTIPTSTLFNWWLDEEEGNTSLLDWDEVEREKRTLWEGVKTRASRQLQEKFFEVAAVIDPSDPKDTLATRCRNLTTSAAILLDKLLLLQGEAIARSESRNLNRNINDSRQTATVITVPAKDMSGIQLVDGVVEQR
jgi:hypothetical protein